MKLEHKRDNLIGAQLSVPSNIFDSLAPQSVGKKLQKALQVPLTVVSAPIGYRKTEVVANWYNKLQCKKAWLDLDKQHNAPQCFLNYLYTMLDEVGVNCSVPLYKGQDKVLSEAIALFNSIQEPVVFVFDNFETLRNQIVIKVLELFMQNAAHKHFVFITKLNESGLYIEKQTQGALVDININDLSYTLQDTNQLFTAVQDRLALTENDIKKIHSNTEGWPTGIAMTISHLLDNKMTDEPYSTQFEGPPQIYSLFLYKVFLTQTTEVRNFMMKTSILEQMCQPLCDVIMEQKNSASILRLLLGNNCFIIPTDTTHSWYRYHRLFGQFLLCELEKAFPELVADLHKKACLWYESKGMYSQAIKHANNTDDKELAIRLIRESMHVLPNRGELTNMLMILQNESIINEMHKNITTKLTAALPYFYAENLDLLNQAYWEWEEFVNKQASEKEHIIRSRAYFNILRASLMRSHGDVDEALSLMEDILLTLKKTDRLYALALTTKCYALERKNDLQKTTDNYHLAIASTKLVKAYSSCCFCVFRLSRIYIMTCKLFEAYDLCTSFLEYTKQQSFEKPPLLSLVHASLGSILCEWNRMQEAEFHFDYALQLIESEAMPSFKYHAYLMAADFYIAKGDYGQANNMIEMANKNISEIRTYPTSLLTNVRRIPIYLAQNDILASNRSKRILKDASLSPSVDIKHNVSYSIALVLYANEDYEEAVSVLLMLLKALEGTHFEDAKLRACVLLALSQYRNNDIQEGMKALNIALQVSAYENYQRLFLKAPEPIKEMLEKALEQKGLNRVIHKYVDELVRQLNEQNISVTPNFLLSEESAMPTGENKFALTDREREILNLIAQGYSNQQIEKNLYISINTVKKHLKNLYRKLDVSSRTQAITAGRRANLIK